ncbi:MAG TPA: LytTR family DNA-binding domain-containing protein [Flavilitoribacter sp.]|nr:LytTR family DNA-binding domain-containing protein [Flavilitoribacter sp.]HMQ91057.1 LytTR family DNA-binding domain-containing protein [Flavilitoribacter sp.]
MGGILITIASVGTCIGITHAYKLFAHRYEWHLMGIAALIPRILAAILVLAAAYSLFNLSINHFFWQESSFWGNAVNISAGGIRYNAIWLLIFHFYHFSRRKGNAEEVDTEPDESFEMLPSRGFNGQPAAAPEQIFVKDGEKCFFIPIGQIERIEALGNYVQIFFDGRKAVAKRSLAEVEERLDANRFFRANRAAIISLKHISAVKALSKGKLSVVLQSGTEIVLSERKSVQFKAQLSL